MFYVWTKIWSLSFGILERLKCFESQKSLFRGLIKDFSLESIGKQLPQVGQPPQMDRGAWARSFWMIKFHYTPFLLLQISPGQLITTSVVWELLFPQSGWWKTLPWFHICCSWYFLLLLEMCYIFMILNVMTVEESTHRDVVMKCFIRNYNYQSSVRQILSN